jgi:U3 small nucleolar RNA-associated protein 22
LSQVAAVALQCGGVEPSTIELAVPLPRDCLHAKDYLNHRYHAKRLLYLTHLAEHLKGLCCQPPHFIVPHGDIRRPVLHLKPKNALFGVALHIIAPAEAFIAAKLGPERNALRTAHLPPSSQNLPFNNKHAAQGTQSDSEKQLLATPVYNAGVLSDMFYHQHCCKVATMLRGCAELQHAARLLERWLQAQMPKSAHWGALLDAVLAKLAEEVFEGGVVRLVSLYASTSCLAVVYAEEQL